MSWFRRRLMMAKRGSAEMPNYLAFTALEDGTFTLTIGAKITTNNFSYVEYSIDNGRTWVKTSNIESTEVIVTTPTITEGNSVYWRGSGIRMNQGNSGANLVYLATFSSTCKFSVSGLIMSLLDGENVTEDSSISYNYTFPRLFWNNTNLVDASMLILPKNTNNYCYDSMFESCSNLAYPPQLPSTTLSECCYRKMFRSTAIIEAPILLANTLVKSCYQEMFSGCKEMRYIKILATDVSASNCMIYWVSGTTNTSEFVQVKHIDATWSSALSNWKIVYYDPSTDKYYLDDKTTECDDHGNVIN